jgi:hypothetical protein
MTDAQNEFAVALNELYVAAGRPNLSMLVRQGRAQVRPVMLNDASLSDWLRGVSVPRRAEPVQFLVEFLQPRAIGNGNYRGHTAQWWEQLRKRASDERNPTRSHRARTTGTAAVDPDPRHRHKVGIAPRLAGGFQIRSAAADLDAAMTAGGTTAVLSGLGGVGKTQLAAALAHRTWMAGEVDLLIWISATSRDGIVSRYAEALAAIVNSPHDNPRVAAERMLTWLEETDRTWVIVLDDLTDPGDLKNLWPPPSPNGRTIVTTRRRDAVLTSSGRQLIPVDLFTPAEAREYLHHALEGDETLLGQSDCLASDLGHLPLALAQAVAYIRDRGLTCAQYRLRWADLRRRLSELLPEPGALPDNHDATAATTWSLSVDLANELTPTGLARPLLEIASLLDPNGIPVAVLTTPPALAYLASRAGGAHVDTDTAHDALRCLYRLSLADLATDGPTPVVRVHALVQRATREGLTDGRLSTVARVTADSVLHLLSDRGSPPTLRLALRTNTHVLRGTAGDILLTPNIHRVLIRFARGLCRAGMIDAAITTYRGLLADSRRVLGPDHPDTLLLRSDEAWVRGEAGDVGGAIDALTELLPDQLRVCGPEDQETLSTRQLLARWQARSGDLEGAIAAGTELLADCVRSLGPDHPITLFTRHNLAYARAQAGDTADATALFTELLDDRLRVLGPDDRATLLTRHNLAWLKAQTGDPHEAAGDFDQLITDCQRALGPEHPATLAARHDANRVLGDTGDLAGAVAAFTELLADRSRVLGPDHPTTELTREQLRHWQRQLRCGP